MDWTIDHGLNNISYHGLWTIDHGLNNVIPPMRIRHIAISDRIERF
jgi:hypothetical protein